MNDHAHVRRGLHPAVRLSLWLLALCLAQVMSLAWGVLGVPLCALGVALAGGRAALWRAAHLLWRTRWLLLTLGVVFAWGVPGEALCAWSWAPSIEGLATAGMHLLRLAGTLLLVAGLLSTLPDTRLLAALHVLCAPLRHIGVAFERGLVRLVLVLRLLESGVGRDWRVLLRSAAQAEGAAGQEESVHIEVWPLHWGERILIGACWAGMLLVGGWAWRGA